MSVPALMAVVAALAWPPSEAHPAASEQAPLPPAAQQAFERGMAAAAQEAWDLAVRSFDEAQQAAPSSPRVLFNLGLAQAKVAHELAGIAWLRAYLAAAPSADNAEAVRAEIDRLKAAAQAKRAAIFHAAVEAAQQLPEEPHDARLWALAAVIRSQAYAGDVEGAMATSRLIGPERLGDERADFQGDYAQTLATVGDVAGAQQLLEQVTGATRQDPIWDAMSESLQTQGDLLGAWKAAQHIQDDGGRHRRLQGIAAQQVEEAGDLTLAEDVIPRLEETDRLLFFLRIARRQCEAGDLAGARQTIDRMPAGGYGRARALRELALVQRKSGDVAGAQATAHALLALKSEGLIVGDDDLAVAHALLGTPKEAYALAAHDVHYGAYLTTAQEEAYRDIAFIQALAGDMKAVRKTARLAAEHFAKHPKDQRGIGAVEGGIAEAQAARGDLAGALKTATESPAKWLPFDRAMRTIVDAHLAHGEIPQALQAAQELARWRTQEPGAADAAFSRIAAAQAKAGALAGAEQTIALMPPSDGKIDALLALAEAQRHAQASAEAARVLAAARDLLLSADPAIDGSITEIVAEMARGARRLRQIAERQASVGDQDGAKTTRSLIELAQWLSLARGFRRAGVATHLAEELKSASTRDWDGQPVASSDVPDRIAAVGRTLGTYLIAIESLEHRSAD